MAGAVTRSDLTARDLRAAAAKSGDARAARRMLALVLVLEGVDRKTAAETCGMDRQTLRDWAHRTNAEGLAGLVNRRTRPRRLGAEQTAELAGWVDAGPDPASDGVVRWRRQDLQRRIAERFRVGLHERTVDKYLAALGYRRLSVRPRHPKADPEARGGRSKKLPRGGSGGPARGGPRQASGNLVSRHEARVGQQGTLTRIWARRGTRPRAPRDTRYQWACIFGAVCPARGVAAGLVLPFADTEAMNAHLAAIARTVAPRARTRSWCSTAPAGTAAENWSRRRTSRFSSCRPTLPS